MAASTAKRLILYRFDRPPVEVSVQLESYLQAEGIQFLTLDGAVQTVEYSQIKAACFASSGAPADLFAVESVFERRPKLPGLWVSFQLRDGDAIDGILPPNIAGWPREGYVFTPPKSGSHRQRVFLPHQAVRETSILGLNGKGKPLGAKPAKRAGAERQMSFFD